MTHPLPENLIRRFASQVARLIVIEELDPFLEDCIRAMGLAATGKDFVPRTGELNSGIIEAAASTAGLLPSVSSLPAIVAPELPKRPPLLCSGCPHSGFFYVLGSLSKRLDSSGSKSNRVKEPAITVTGDIGCYTLGTYPPLNGMDTCACMGASIGQALGMEKAGVNPERVVAVIGDSTFLHSGITPLVNAVYNEAKVTIVILDNRTTAMTGHQEHPGTGISAQGKETRAIELEPLVRGIGVKDVRTVDAFNLKDLRVTLKSSLDNPEVSVIIVRGACSVHSGGRNESRVVTTGKCNLCGLCLQIGCPAIQRDNERIDIDPTLCAGEVCTVCQQVCPHMAIVPESEIETENAHEEN